MKKQETSNVITGRKDRFSDVVTAAKDAGDDKPVKVRDDEPMAVPAGNRKSFRIDCVHGGYKLCWNKAGQWQEEEGIAESIDKALEAARAYLTAADYSDKG